MLDKLAGLVLRRPKRVLLISLLCVLVMGALAGGLQKRLSAGGYDDSTTQSSHAEKVLEDVFGQGDPNLVLLAQAKGGVDSPSAEAAGQALTAKLAGEKDVSNVVSYWTAGHLRALRGKDGGQALVLARITGSDDHIEDRVKALEPEYRTTFHGLKVQVGGSALMMHENTDQSAKDATKADMVVFPIMLIVLVLVFGSVFAAFLPLAVSFATMITAMAVMWVLTFLMDTSVSVLNVVTFLGLGLAIDYGLLITTRYREELRNGADPEHALRATLHTAGRTVLFSALTVAVVVSGLLVFPFYVMRSLGLAAIATSLLAAVAAVVVVPSMLAWMGPRVDKWRLYRAKPRPAAVETGFWHRLATMVMRRPVPVVTLVLAFVIVLGLPVFGINLRLPDEQVLPSSSHAAQVATVLRHDFDSREQSALQVVARHAGDPKTESGRITQYAQRLSGLPGVARVDTLTGSYAKGTQVAPAGPLSQRFAKGDALYLNVVPSVDPYSSKGEDLARDLRAARSPFPVMVGGESAVQVDTFDRLGDALPWAILIVALGMFVLLFLLTGSVVLPLLALVLSTLSLSATFGALVWGFQDGHLNGVVGDFNVTGAITWTVPIMLFGLAFGLSMDYQVFLLSRIREEYERTGDNTAAVAGGLERVGRVVTYAAILISIVFLVWTTSGISYMKAFGIGLPLAILVDATIIRGAMLPALMRLCGRATWWAPGWMRKVHDRFGLREAGEYPAPHVLDDGSTQSPTAEVA
jgi:putative drug exporter of the RND superfamily